MAEYCGKKGSSLRIYHEDCPLCLEKLDIDDQTFYPCTCGYQVCRFCWHRIRCQSERTDESNGRCPSCRKLYSEDPAHFEPHTVEGVKKILRAQKLEQEELMQQQALLARQNETLARKQICDSRKLLTELRVIQKNLIFVLGIGPKIADVDLLKTDEYFGQFGKVHSVVLVPNPNPKSAESCCGAFITYLRSEDALQAIQSINTVSLGIKKMKASLGTAKYCTYYTRNQVCRKADCTFLHYEADPEASFTKKDMKRGKHQLYEKKLIEEFKKNCAV